MVIEQVMGQRQDWDQRDDVDQYSVSLGQRVPALKSSLFNANSSSPVAPFEWGFYGIMRTQQNAGAYPVAAAQLHQ